VIASRSIVRYQLPQPWVGLTAFPRWSPACMQCSEFRMSSATSARFAVALSRPLRFDVLIFLLLKLPLH
jgi:hypothetical protein